MENVGNKDCPTYLTGKIEEIDEVKHVDIHLSST